MIENFFKAFQVFTAGIHSLSVYWVAWIYLMFFINGVAPIFFLPKFTAVIVLISSMTGFALGLVLTHALGYSKILGLMHFPWIPMVCFQLFYLFSQNFEIKSGHDYWLLSSLVISSVSLSVDIYDVYKYLIKPL